MLSSPIIPATPPDMPVAEPASNHAPTTEQYSPFNEQVAEFNQEPKMPGRTSPDNTPVIAKDLNDDTPVWFAFATFSGSPPPIQPMNGNDVLPAATMAISTTEGRSIVQIESVEVAAVPIGKTELPADPNSINAQFPRIDPKNTVPEPIQTVANTEQVESTLIVPTADVLQGASVIAVSGTVPGPWIDGAMADVKANFGPTDRPEEASRNSHNEFRIPASEPIRHAAGAHEIQNLSQPRSEAPAVSWPDAIEYMSRHAAMELTSQGEAEFHFRISPPDLGPVRIRLMTAGGGVLADLTVSSDALRHVMETRFPELRDRLEAAGVQISSFTVQLDGQASGDSHRRASWQPSPTAFDEIHPRRHSSRTVFATMKSGLVDITA